MTCECEKLIKAREAEKLALEISKLERDKFQGWGNGLFKSIIAICAIGTLWFTSQSFALKVENATTPQQQEVVDK